MTSERPADLILHGGRVATIDPLRTMAAAVAVRAGRIVAVGRDADVRGMTASGTRVIDLRGRTVTPGFGDAHVHPVTAGVGRSRCDLTGDHGQDAYLATVVAYAASHPDDPWIRGDGWSLADFPAGLPHRAALDRVSPDRPVYLDNRDGHGAWVNSKALELAGITADTPDPADGRIEHDPDGAPSGMLQEGAADLVVRLLPPDTPDELVAGLRLAQTQLLALGITHWQDADVLPQEAEIAYTALAGRGELTARVVGALWWDHARGAEQIEELVERRARTAIGRYAPTSVKFFQDGVLENGSAALLAPYLDAGGQPTTNRGQTLVEPALLNGYVVALDALGFQAHFHAIGDRGVRDALDAVEAARHVNGMTDTRPHIAHIQVVHPDDVGRFARLGVIANAQAYWACHGDQMDVLTVPFLGPERASWQYPFHSLLEAGATLAMGSDWTVSTADPLLQMEVAVTRVADDERGRTPPFLPDERIELSDALAAFTMGSARVDHLEREVGSIEVGKTADMVVLDRDLFDRAAGAIGEARVVATFIDGNAVFEDATLDG